MREATFPIRTPRGAGAAAVALLLLSAGCAEPTRLERLYPDPPAASQDLGALDELPRALRVLPDGRWAVEVAPAAAEPPRFRRDRDRLLVPVAGGRFEAQIAGVRGRPGEERLAWSPEAGLLVVAIAGASANPGTGLIAVSLRDGTTHSLARWPMARDEGFLDVQEMSISPGGGRLACQLVEYRPDGRGGLEAAARRGLVLPLGAGAPIDLGPGIVGPMAWSEDGRTLIFLAPPDRDPGPYVVRRVQVPGALVAAGGEAEAGETAPPAAPAPSPVQRPRRAVDEEALVEQIIRLSSADEAGRLDAARLLGTMPHPMAVGPLLSAMEEGSGPLCRQADTALRGILLRDPPLLAAADGAECARAADAWRAWWESNPDALRP